MVSTKLNLSINEPYVRTVYAKEGDTGRVFNLDIDPTPTSNGTMRIKRPDGVEVTSPASLGEDITESGEVVSFNALDEAPLTSLKVGIEPIQDLHGQSNPYPAGAINVLPPAVAGTYSSTNINVVADNNGNYTITGTSSGSESVIIPLANSFICPPSSSHKFCMMNSVGIATVALYFYNDNTLVTDWACNPANRVATSYSAMANKTINRIVISVTNSTTVSMTLSPMIIPQSLPNSPFVPYSNICPIYANVGKNMASLSASTYYDGQRSTVNYDGATTVITATNSYGRSGWIFPVTPNKAYTLSFKCYGDGDFNNVYFAAKEGTGKYATPSDQWAGGNINGAVAVTSTETAYTRTFTALGDYVFVGCYVTSSATSGSMTVKDMQLELGSSATSYVPYNTQTVYLSPTESVADATAYNTTLPQLVYGGTLDVAQGKLTVTHQCVTLDSSLDSKWYRSSSYQGGYYVSWTNINSIYGTSFGSIPNGYAIKCSHAKTVSSLSDYLNGTCYAEVGNLDIRIMSESSTLAEWKQYIADQVTAGTPIQIWAKVGTPIVIDLTPQQINTLIGENNLWASCGDVLEVKFAYDGMLSALPSQATEVVGRCIGDVELGGVSTMPFTLVVQKNNQGE